ncbi:hypothetical protein J2S75_002872 [Ancylobacter polymorphus]|uniref:Uncharacterized protein n=1 Tax=Ancylobacter polymorphus TaxID=223390 RepID=A0ABU0BDC6_9HYPH|nr:hypothetical protein [Ancylobacter polymorphus]
MSRALTLVHAKVDELETALLAARTLSEGE